MHHHRSAIRAQTDVPVSVFADGHVFECRAIDLSTQGAVVERADGLLAHEARPFYWLSFAVGQRGVRVLARPAWKSGKRQAFRFILITDPDKLTLAEHMDASSRLWGTALHLRAGGGAGRAGTGGAAEGSGTAANAFARKNVRRSPSTRV